MWSKIYIGTVHTKCSKVQHDIELSGRTHTNSSNISVTLVWPYYVFDLLGIVNIVWVLSIFFNLFPTEFVFYLRYSCFIDVCCSSEQIPDHVVVASELGSADRELRRRWPEARGAEAGSGNEVSNSELVTSGPRQSNIKKQRGHP